MTFLCQTILENDLFSLRKNNEAFKEKAHRVEKENYELQAQLALEKTRFNEVCFIYSIYLLPELFIFQMTALTAEREQALQIKRKEFRAKEDEFIRSKKELEREMEQLKKEIRVDSSQTKFHGRDKELKNMEVGRRISLILIYFLARRPSLGSCYMFNMPQQSTYYDHYEVHA